MLTKKYQLINNAGGWLVFAIALVTYWLTLEPTASYWDCGEFIIQADKLEIGHPPGNPIFMLTARFFANFATSAQTVSVMVNAMSGLLSALTILLLFWTITHLVRRLVVKDGQRKEPSLQQYLAIMGSGLVGSLAYCWSDTFWFSAVEGEVYAFSSFCTALVFWLILKWENRADEPHSDRYLILIAYIIGVSVAVHLLNLLCIPAIVLVFAYRKWKDMDLVKSLITLAVSFVIIFVVLYGLVPGFIKVAQQFELLFVNGFHLSFNSGAIAYAFVMAAIFIWTLRELYAQKSPALIKVAFLLSVACSGALFIGSSFLWGWILIAALAAWLFSRWSRPLPVRVLTVITWSMAVIFVGYSSYALILIRSTADTPMNQNSPDNVFDLASYLNREQYGENPLLYGETLYSSPQKTLEGTYTDTVTYYEGTPVLLSSPAYSPVVEAGKPLYAKGVKGAVPQSDYNFLSEGEKAANASLAARGGDYYVKRDYKPEPKMNPELNMLFPRLYSRQHRDLYSQWVSLDTAGGSLVAVNAIDRTTGEKVPELDTSREPAYNQVTGVYSYPQKFAFKPGWGQNLSYFINYQLNHMYLRYFMWNFAGRQNDLQGSGEIEHGNWITGIKFIDNMLVGNQDLLPKELKENKGHNVFYCLPLLLGIIGLLWQAYRGQKGIQQFWVVFFLFFMTGIAIVLYLNQTPSQPRERDYAYAGSFYAFAIWIGMGVAGIIRLLQHYAKMKELPAAAIVSVACLFVPIQMASQTWDDHDRSGRYVARDFGQNYLMSLQETGNPIIYTNGDNDTFPLWYNQETEGFRTDARTCNLSYLQTDWYIDQMKRPAYDSPSLPITWDRMEYVEGTNEYVPVRPEYKKSIDALYAEAEKQALSGNTEALVNVKKEFGENPYELKNILRYWIRSKNEDLKVIPTDSIVMKVDKEAVRRSGMMIPGDSIPDYMHISLKGKRALYKSELMMLEMLAEANWERPIYIAVSVGPENQLNMGNHFIQEGLTYRFTPFDTDKLGVKIDSEKMYDNLMHKFKFGDIDKPGIYIDENAMRMCHSHRRIFSQLAQQLIREGKKDKAKAALDYAEKMIPAFNVPYDWQNGAVQMAEAYYQLGDSTKADDMMKALADKAVEYLTWYLSMDDNRFSISTREFEYHWAVLDAEVKIMKKYNSKLAEIYAPKVEELYNLYAERYERLQKMEKK